MSHEVLSAVLDGECSPGELDRLLEEIERSPQLARQWTRMCLTREARDGVRITRDQRCICAGVMAGLDQEPAASGKVVEIRGRKPSVPLPVREQRWKPLIGLAAAASVVGFSLVAVLNFKSPAIDTPVVTPAASFSASTSPDASSAKFVPVAAGERMGWDSVASGEDAGQLDNYLIDHSNLRAVSGVSGSLGYARFAAHTSNYRTADYKTVSTGDGR